MVLIKYFQHDQRNKSMLLSIGKITEILDVSIRNLRRRGKEKKYQASVRTVRGHRRYDLYEMSKNICNHL